MRRRSQERRDTYAWIEKISSAGFQLFEDRPILLTPKSVLDEFLQGRGEWWLVTIRDDDECRKLISLSPECPRRLSIIVRASLSEAAVEKLRLQYPGTQIMTAGAYQDGEVKPGR
ncbi:hypothetical protein AYO47_00090 [Planctomyces sp. SCGC AG-212-M04]|nr:hypothetical protein AYO47_00090 [Planctomyces sp. SCGC AG-212-M04]